MSDSDLLVKTDWTTADGVIRMKFRRDGTGYFERDTGGGARLVHERLLWKIEGTALHLKFAHARFWTDVPMSTRAGTPSDDGRFGHQVLELGRDPYAWTLEEKQTGALVLLSDRGAALPS